MMQIMRVQYQVIIEISRKIVRSNLILVSETTKLLYFRLFCFDSPDAPAARFAARIVLREATRDRLQKS